MNRFLGSALTLALALAPGAPAAEPGGAEAAVARVLDDWHAAASAADAARYFGAFAPDGVFLGTDDGERWTVEEFRAYAAPYFAKGQGWTYHPRDRHVAFAPSRAVAWVDEKLDNDHYGRLRGTAVLRRVGAAWKLAHYSMSFPVPNEKTKGVVALIRAPEVEGEP